MRWTWTQWECGCIAFSLLRVPHCIHIVASAYMLSTAGDLLGVAQGVVGVAPTTTYYLRSADSSLHISVRRGLWSADGGARDQLILGGPGHADPVVKAIPAGATEVRLTPELGRALAPRLEQAADIRLDGQPVFVSAEPLMIQWIGVERDGSLFRCPVPLWPRPEAEFPGSECAVRDGTLQFTRIHDHPMFTTTEAQLQGASDALDRLLDKVPEIKRLLERWTFPQSAPAVPGVAVSPASPALPQGSIAQGPREPTAEPIGRPAPAPTGAATSGRPEAPTPTLSPRWRAGGGDYDVTFATVGPAGETHELPSSRVVPEWRAGARTIEVTRGVVAQLPDDWLERYGPILERLHAARDVRGRLQRWGRPVAATLCQALKEVPPPELAGLAALVDDFAGIPTAQLPAALRAELRDYQRRGVDWLCLLRDAELGALLADDMGLGKTVQTICALKGRTLVVAPTSTLHNWVAEIRPVPVNNFETRARRI